MATDFFKMGFLKYGLIARGIEIPFLSNQE